MNKLRKGIVVTVILLFISVSIGSSTSNKITDVNIYESSLEVKENFKKTLLFNTTVYGFLPYGPQGPCFFAYYPNNTQQFREWEGEGYFFAGTWTNDGRFLCCLYENGTLYDVNPETLEPTAIGNGGNSLTGLAYNPVNEKLYGASSNNFYEINISTGNQTYIGAFNIGSSIISIVFDNNGTCYAWDVKFSGDSFLYEVDKQTGEATQLFSFHKTLCYAQDGDFNRVDGLIYLSANIYSPEYGGYFCKVDVETEEFTIIDMFENGINPTAFAISYELNNEPPVTTISFDPPEPNGCNGWYVSNVTVTLNATDNSGVLETYYRINGGDWEIYYSPFVISKEGDDILIEYYSVDIHGNEEDVKSATISIDKTPPEITVDWKVEKIGWRKWRVTFIMNVTDNTSGSDNRLDIYINDALQQTITGPGPTYYWSFVMPYGAKFSFKFVAWDMACNQGIAVVNSSDICSIVKTKSLVKQYPFYFQGIFVRFPFIQRLVDILGRIF